MECIQVLLDENGEDKVGICLILIGGYIMDSYMFVKFNFLILQYFYVIYFVEVYE